ncbi:F0F1 ATP synthase subunit B' [Pontibaca methylaminivorans]|uniref:F0F1 ATP synthase subunit B' n=1 Tax=Pontibaca methylaminivorans TaxID=515897 RepID=UPI002FDAD9B6
MESDALDTAAQGAADSGPGLPQLNFEHFGNQIFWLLVTLVVIYLILSRVALPRIAAILAERQGTITHDLAYAEELKTKARAAEDAYEKALADARAEAQEIVGQARAEIQADVDEAMKRADAEIAARTAESEKAIAEIRAGAMESVREVAGETAAALVTALGGKSDEGAIRAAVDRRVEG